MKLLWAVICQRALIDQFGSVSLIQIIDALDFPLPPENLDASKGLAISFPITIVTTWQRDRDEEQETANARIRMASPDGRLRALAEFIVDLGTAKGVRCVTQTPQIPYRGPGMYSVRVEIASGKRWKKLGDVNFELKHNAQTGTPAARKPLSH